MEQEETRDASTEGRPAQNTGEPASSLCFKPPERLACEFATEFYKLSFLATVSRIVAGPEPEDPEEQLPVIK